MLSIHSYFFLTMFSDFSIISTHFQCMYYATLCIDTHHIITKRLKCVTHFSKPQREETNKDEWNVFALFFPMLLLPTIETHFVLSTVEPASIGGKHRPRCYVHLALSVSATGTKNHSAKRGKNDNFLQHFIKCKHQ
jgi:hypothetical protein